MISPEVGFSSCKMQRPVVVLPQPDSPTRPRGSPRRVEELTPSPPLITAGSPPQTPPPDAPAGGREAAAGGGAGEPGGGAVDGVEPRLPGLVQPRHRAEQPQGI